MSIDKLRAWIAPAAARRGDDYFSQGRVRRLSRFDGHMIHASVQGRLPYHVILEFGSGVLYVECDCPAFEQDGACKHIWATIRAADERRLLPRGLNAMETDFLSDEMDSYEAFGDPHRPDWEALLDSIESPAAVPQNRNAPIPEEIAYVISPGILHPLTVRLSSRSRKKNGEWGRWKPPSLDVDDLARLDSFDRESIGLLQPRSYGRIDSAFTLLRDTNVWWMERLARAGRLRLEQSNVELRPVAWDEGEPWAFRIAIAGDANRKVYRIEGAIERDGETLPFENVQLIANGIVVARDRAARLDAASLTSWLRVLRANGPIEVPFSDLEQFRKALLRTPLAGVTLPEELGWEIVQAQPQPVLSLDADSGSAELAANLSFEYDEWRIASRSSEMQKTIGRKMFQRDLAQEEAFRARLGALGVISTWDGFRIRFGQLDRIAQQLALEGWSIEIDSEPLLVPEDVDLEISSGIDWFDLHVSVAFGDTRIELPQLLAAAEANRTLLRLPNGAAGIVPSSWKDALAPLLDLGKRQGDTVRFRSSQALLVDALLQSKAHVTDAAFADLRNRLTSIAPSPLHEPPTLTATLRPYQRAGLGWLHFLRDAGLGGCLADDMGLGKTVQALALLESLRAAGTERPSLVVAPRSLLFNWAAEAARFAPQLRVREHHGADRERSEDAFTDCDVVLTTYATMRLDIEHLSKIELEYVILDEAQAIKNSSSQVAKSTLRLRSRHRLALTGTPIENHLGEIWSLFQFLDPGLLGPSRAFQRTFAAKNTPPERRDALARALRPLILRRTKEQVAPELPARTEQTLHCELEGEQRRLYDELRDHYRQSLLGRVRKGGIEKSRMQILEALLRLRQAACHPALIDRNAGEASAKSELLMSELREILQSGHRALVFSQFTSFLAIVRRALDAQHIPYLYLDGKTKDRQRLVEQFQGEDGPPLFLISLKAGGLGLNLTNADYIFLLDPWWNPAVEAQAIDRAHRIGRVRPVVAYRLIARDTVEEKILELQAQKRELAESIISEDNSVLRRIELEDLELLLS